MVTDTSTTLQTADGTPAPGLWTDTDDNATIRFELSVDQAAGTLIRDVIWQVAEAGRIS